MVQPNLDMTSYANPVYEAENNGDVVRDDVIRDDTTYSNTKYQSTGSQLQTSNNYGKSKLANDASPDKLYDPSLRYGWRTFSSDCLQKFNNPVCFLICSSIAVLGEGFVVVGMAFSSLTSIETQFGYTSSEVAMFMMAYEVAVGIISVFIGYLGYLHKPRCIAWSLIIMAAGAVIVSVPKFVIGTYEAGIERVSDYCSVGGIENHDPMCHIIEPSYYKVIFTVGFALLGIGAVPLWTLIPAHLEDVADRKQSSLYMGIYYGVNAVGPAVGFLVGEPILSKWVDLQQPPNSFLKPTDTNWVGAWWLGFLIGGGFLLLPVIPLLGFPKEFPDTKILRVRKQENEDIVAEDENLKQDLKSVWPALRSLLTNPPYIFLCLTIAAESLAIGGFSAFVAKFVHIQFHVTEGTSSLYTGCMVIPGAVIGITLGGYLVKRYDWNCKQILRFATVMAFLSALCMVIALVGCEGRKVVGQQDESTGLAHNFTHACNGMCGCTTEFYKPICSVEDQKTYFSPCHAGCQKNDSIDGEYFNCTCFSHNVSSAVDGRCTDECTLFPLFAIGMVIAMLLTFLNNIPMVIATLRVVNAGQGSFALGVGQILVRFLGFVPGPIMFGALIDASCVLWQRDPCSSETSNCLEYNQTYFRYYLFAGGITTKFASFVFISVAYKLYRLPKKPISQSVGKVQPVDTVVENNNVTSKEF